MRIDITENRSWYEASAYYREWLIERLPDFSEASLQVQAFLGYQQALFESAWGLARLFSHKKTIAIVGPTEPSLEALGIEFSAEGYVVKHFSFEEVVEPTWLAPVEKDLLVVVFVEDDPVTAENYPVENLIRSLEGKRVFRLSISHARHQLETLKRPVPFEGRILSHSNESAVLIAGERYRITPSIAPRLPFRKPQRPRHLQSDDQQKLITDFESSLPAGWTSYFGSRADRTFDRSVIYRTDVDGSAVAECLAQRLGLASGKPGDEVGVEATSACRWSSGVLKSLLQKRSLSEEIVRGLLILDSELLKNQNLPQSLRESLEEVLTLQKG